MNKLKLIFASGLAIMMTACSDDNKMKSFWEQCSADPTGCMAMYRNAANQAGTTAIIGPAAAAGLPQVAAANTTPVDGQVPNTTVLPASISKAEIEARAAQIKQALTKMNLEGSSSASSTVAASTSSTGEGSGFRTASAGGSSQAEIGVTRLPDHQEYEDESRQPASYSNQTGLFDTSESEPSSYSAGGTR
jgi:hypothetical protein